MKHWVTYPMITHPYDPDFVSKDALQRFARTAEAVGFDGIGFTDQEKADLAAFLKAL